MEQDNTTRLLQYPNIINSTSQIQLPSGFHLVTLEGLPTDLNHIRVVNADQINPTQKDKIIVNTAAAQQAPVNLPITYNLMSDSTLANEETQDLDLHFPPADRKSVSVQCDSSDNHDEPINKSQGSFMMEHLNKLRRSGQFCDVVIHTGPNRWHCHACVLSSIPKLLRAMRSHPYPSQSAIHLKIPDCFTSEAVGVFLNYLYCSTSFQLHVNNVYQHDNLMKECKKFAKQSAMTLKRNPEDKMYPLLTITDNGCFERSGQPTTDVETINQPMVNISGPSRSNKGATKRTNNSNFADEGEDETKKFMCEKCGKRFRFRHLMRRHYDAVHLKLKPHKCQVCGVGFSRPEELKQHEPSHTGARNYKCNVCSKTFRQSASLYLHMKLHLDGKKYTCDICGYRTYLPRLLKLHQQTHKKNFLPECVHCHRKFKTARGMSNHMVVHRRKKNLSSSQSGT